MDFRARNQRYCRLSVLPQTTEATQSQLRRLASILPTVPGGPLRISAFAPVGDAPAVQSLAYLLEAVATE